VKSIFSTIFLALILISSPALAPALADEPHHHDATEKLGTISFPISCSPTTQSSFERGVALLHSFEYQEANEQFQALAKTDPQCAMIYWGQAMSLYHQLWERPKKEALEQGAALLEKAVKLNPPTASERDYIQALSVFFRDPDSLDHAHRAEAYAKAMAGVADRNPHDREAAIFYALSLLGSQREDDPDHVNAKRAVAILNKLFDEEPNHPGIAHYIIHACDNPQMAGLGLAAALKYAGIASSSAHAVHMPSHIFARLGLWQDDIQSNLNSLKAADQMAGMHLHVIHHKVHSMDFLEYAYLQIGDDADAKGQITAIETISPADVDPDFEDYFVVHQASFPATYSIERRQWGEALALQPIANAIPEAQAVTYWARAIAAGHLHDAAAAQDALQHFNDLLEATRKGPKPYLADAMKDDQKVAQAWASYAAGQNPEALSLLRSVADKQDKVGKGETELPAREMLADMLLELGRPQDALAEYDISQRTDPNRFNALFGAAQAANQTHQPQKAAAYYAQLLKNCQSTHSDRQELATASAYLTTQQASIK
jgi:tetratricopeptide (TPR) repeat protein